MRRLGQKSSLREAKRRRKRFAALNVDLAIAYPITPQSETMQLVGVLYGEGYVKEYYRGEEEVGVMAAIAGGSRAGVRCYTATAGPGTLRGLEGIASWPGHRLPVVAMFTCRVVNAPLAIQPDNIEVSLPAELRHDYLPCREPAGHVRFHHGRLHDQ